MKCPSCGSSHGTRERRPNGNTNCNDCNMTNTSAAWDDVGGLSEVIPIGLAPDPATEEDHVPSRRALHHLLEPVLEDALGTVTFERLSTLDEYFDGIGFKAVLTVLITEAYMDRKAVFLEAGEAD